MADTKTTWRKPPAELVAMFGELASVLPPDVERRKMFGCPCCFVNGQMFAGVHQENIMVRLGEAERRTLLAQGWRLFEPMAGRPMREYVVLPQALLSDKAAVLAWLERGLAFARTLPAKQARR